MNLCLKFEYMGRKTKKKFKDNKFNNNIRSLSIANKDKFIPPIPSLFLQQSKW